LTLVLEGALVVAVLTIALMGTQMPGWMIYARTTPAVLLITLAWIIGIWLVNKARHDLPWRAKERAFVSQEMQAREKTAQKEKRERLQGMGKIWPIVIFGMGAIVTLIAGVALEETGNAIAKHLGMSGVLFGATILAAATALPEVSTGFASVKLGDYEMAVSDIFGGNAFLPVLFLFATLLSGEAVLPKAGKIDIYLTALGILLTAVYMIGLIFRPRRQFARLGIDSWVVLLLYMAGLAGLFAVMR
jgi:cation:H+ antiporter